MYQVRHRTHATDRTHALIWAAKKKSGLGAALVFTGPGIPMLFQGQEFLEDDWFHDKDPLDWSKKTRYAGMLALYRDLIALRLNRHGNTAGLCGQGVDVFHVDQEHKILACHRWDQGGPGDSVVVAVNFSTHPHEDVVLAFPRAGDWHVRFNSDSAAYDPDFGDAGPKRVRAETAEDEDNGAIRGVLTLPPYSALILSQDPE